MDRQANRQVQHIIRRSNASPLELTPIATLEGRDQATNVTEPSFSLSALDLPF